MSSESMDINSKSSDSNGFYVKDVSSHDGESKWQHLKNSFKRAERDDKFDEQDLDGLERAIQKTSKTDLSQNLKKRQLQMIAIGGCVGLGLFIGVGPALTNGPASLLIAWGLVSTFLYCTMQSLAELAALFPISGSFSTYATRFVDPSWGFAVGWNYAIFWVVVLPLELVASSMTINFWQSDINSVAWVAIFYVLIIGLNLCGNKGFGEAEFIASLIKVLGIIGFNILAIVLICGGGQSGFIGAEYWHNPGAFAAGFKGVVSVLITATYSLAGTELVGLTAAETAGNPRIVLPSAIKQVFWRILLFYMITLTLVGFLVPYDSPDLLDGSSSSDASASPFVIAIKAGGITALPSIFNVIVLISLLSIGNSSVYGFSRTILSLAEQGLAPKCFDYVDRKGRPLVGILASAIVGLLSFVAASPKQTEVFAWLMALSGLSTLFTWFSVNLSHIRFRLAMKKQGRSLDELPYRALTGFWGSVYAAVLLFIVLCLQFWISLFPLGQSPNATTFFENYLGAVVVLVFLVSHKLYSRKLNTIVPLATMDLDTGRRETDIDKLKQELKEEKDIRDAHPIYRKIWNFLF
ncbi:uncharacterized protein AC631_05324 [Debaryomyces fabryi]|uniref:Amino acid permease/ SLC12A domain-containing protein n=1 Tax=Debaryomyces fabryi TaxID=58627 RepID=A0A0V1PS03_9ASCO|nr:uncharacterized protein AC631_05324 [Debaryomyces fabryi]KRZ98921.1 hypothetical protein AC631_05324 [Debaryomyces fabryi]CUM46402.1 unnamed protein product [Debaryomyces fabryi]